MPKIPLLWSVFDDTGNPLPGATVSVKGSDGVGSITDFDGNYSVNIPEGSDTNFFLYWLS